MSGPWTIYRLLPPRLREWEYVHVTSPLRRLRWKLYWRWRIWRDFR